MKLSALAAQTKAIDIYAEGNTFLYPAGNAFAEVAKEMTHQLGEVDNLKRQGAWADDQKFSVLVKASPAEARAVSCASSCEYDAVDGAHLIARLRELHDRAKRLSAELPARFDAALDREFPGASPAQRTMLHDHGPPIEHGTPGALRAELGAIVRGKAHECWIWSYTEYTCWTKAGVVAPDVVVVIPRSSTPTATKREDTDTVARNDGTVYVDVIHEGGCQAVFTDPETGRQVGNHEGWYKPGTTIQACDDDVIPHCFTSLGQVQNKREQTVTARCP